MEDVVKGMVSDLCGEGLFNGIIADLSINLFSISGSYSSVLSTVKTVHSTVVQPVAVMLMLIFFIIALVDKMSSENFTWEQLGRQMAMFFASFYLINHGFELLELLFQLGLLLSQDMIAIVEGFIDGGGTEANTIVTELVDNFKDDLKIPTDFLKEIVLFLYLFLPWALSWIIGLVVKIICYTRIIEIYARASMAPVAFSDFFLNGFQGAGWQFLKSFLAVCLQGAVILVIATIYSMLFTVILDTIGTGWSFFKTLGLFVAFMASGCMLMFKSLSISKELLGVH